MSTDYRRLAYSCSPKAFLPTCNPATSRFIIRGGRIRHPHSHAPPTQTSLPLPPTGKRIGREDEGVPTLKAHLETVILKDYILKSLVTSLSTTIAGLF